MTAWKALFCKEIRAGLPVFFVLSVFYLLLMSAGIWFDVSTRSHGTLLIYGAMIIFTQLFYPAAYLVVDTVFQRRTFQLWLYNPLPGWAMLIAKLLSALLYMTVSAAAGIVYYLVGLFLAKSHEFPWEAAAVPRVMLFIATFYWGALLVAVACLFFLLLFLVLRSRLGRVLSGIAALGGFAIFELFCHSAYPLMTEWGALTNGPVKLTLAPGSSLQLSSIYTGRIVFDLLTMCILFGLASWLMDHELEA